MSFGLGSSLPHNAMARVSRCGVSVILAGLLAACSTTGQTFDTAGMSQIVPGQTTLEQAGVILKAQPENVYRQNDGTAMARWAHKATVLTDAIYFRRELWLQFGSDGRFERVVNRINVLAEPGQPEHTGSATMPAAYGAPAYTSVVPAAPTSDAVDRSLPGAVPAGFPYSADSFSGPTSVYPVR